jgi:hypothetical protein
MLEKVFDLHDLFSLYVNDLLDTLKSLGLLIELEGFC